MRLDKSAWDRWTTAIIKVKDDLQATVNDRAVFQGFTDLVRENEDWIGAHEGMFFCQFVLRAYVARVALGVRRQVKMQDDSLSLLRILSQMKECADRLTFDFYLERFPRKADNAVPWQELTFKNYSDDGRVASAGQINGDIEEIKRLTTDIEAYADRTLAHLDKRGYDGTVTFDDLDNAVEALDRIACKYICLLTGLGYTSLEATIQFDWKKIFSVPWRQPEPPQEKN